MTSNRADDALAARFVAHFGHAAETTIAAPGRVNLIGEHVDYHGGLVLPMAIDQHLRILAAPAGRTHSRVHSTQLGTTISARLHGDDAIVADGSLAMRLSAAIRGARRLVGAGAWTELDLLIDSDLPIGGGVSSSAALSVAAALAAVRLARGAQTGLDPLSLAHCCRDAERDAAGVACGLMDPLTVIAGQRGHALLTDCRSGRYEPIPLPDRLAWLLVDTGVRHDLADGGYGARQRECDAAAQALGVDDLRDAAERGITADALPRPLAQRARHAITEHGRTLAMVAALRCADLRALGAILNSGHASLRDDFGVSCAELDEAVAAALRVTPAALGARMTGAGFGGCVIVATTTASVDALHAALADLLPSRCTITRVRAADGALRI